MHACGGDAVSLGPVMFRVRCRVGVRVRVRLRFRVRDHACVWRGCGVVRAS